MASVNNHETRISNLENMYRKQIQIDGDANTYYPVDILLDRRDNGYDNLLVINRSLGEKCCPTYDGNHDNKTSSMTLTLECRLGGWDGNGNRCYVKNLIQSYANLVADIYINNSAYTGIVVWLRGGGTVYNIKCDCGFTATIRYNSVNLGSSTYPVNVAPKTNVKTYDDLLLSGCSSKIIGVNSLISGYLKSSGDIRGNKVYNAVWNDYAEYFPKGEDTEPGDIIALDINSNKEQYIKANNNSRIVVGVHSDSFGHLIGGEELANYRDNDKKYIPIGLSGRVYVKVKGKVCVGDYIIPSEIDGVGKPYNKETDEFKNVVGYVVESDCREDIRRVKIFISNLFGGGKVWLV